MQRYAVFFRLKEGAKDEYKKRHDGIWDEMEKALGEAGFFNYSIWNLEDMLFGYYETEDKAAMDKYLSTCEIYQKWRSYMEEVIYKDPATGKKEDEMDLMYFFSGKSEV